jgi:4-aminobutyrate aminotransferase
VAHLSPLLRQATPIVVAEASGLQLLGDDGREFMDFTAGIGVTSTGHCHPHVVKAIQDQSAKLLHGQYVTVKHQPLLELCKRLGAVLPDGLDALFFANSGSEAIESAIRLARQATKRPTILAFQGAFHGRTMGAASITSSSPRFVHGSSPLMGGTHISPFPDARRWGCTPESATNFALQEFDHCLKTVTAPDEVAAVFVEPVLGEGGCVPATVGFLEGLRERANEHGFLIVFDEVQTGFGRTGRFWAHQHYDVAPDILVAAKGMTSGLPLSVMAAPTALMNLGHNGSQGGTYSANVVSCAAAIATLDVIESENLVANAFERGEELASGLRDVAASNEVIEDVRGLGLMIGCEIARRGRADAHLAEAIQASALRQGLILQRGGPYRNVIRCLPALTVTNREILTAVDIFRSAASESTQRLRDS